MGNLFDDFDLDVKKITENNYGIKPLSDDTGTLVTGDTCRCQYTDRDKSYCYCLTENPAPACIITAVIGGGKFC